MASLLKYDANGAYYARHEHFERLLLYNAFLKEKELKKKTKVKFKISAQLSMHIGGKFRKMMDGQRARRMQSDDT